MRWRLRWQLRLVVAAFVALASSLPAQAQAPVQKILCLHGGGMNGPDFRRNPGIAAIMAELPGYEYVFPTAPYGSGGGNIWIRDPPGGKGSATTDPGFADDSLALLDDVVASEGPFYGILGYSQGSAFVPIYIAHAPLGTFKVAFMFCGYLTTTHLGLLDTVNAASPFGGIPALVWMVRQASSRAAAPS
jgi:predicted esterase